jgi:4-amino-4-deoxy-L-arabinose transferase-like glycosyltransferase
MISKIKATTDILSKGISALAPIQAILVISAISVLVKLVYIHAFGGGLGTFPEEGTDAGFYNLTARVLWKTGVFGLDPAHPNVGMPPGQSVFMAVLYALSNGSIIIAKLAHVLLLTIVAIITYLTGKQLANGQVGFWAGILIAIDPAQAYLAGTFLSEPLFMCFMALGIYALVKQQSLPSSRWLIGAGVCFALAGLTRNQGWLFAAALWLGAVATLGRLYSIRNATIVLLVTLATIAPWTLRNYAVSGKFIPVSAEGGLTLWSSNNPEFVWRQPMPMSLPIYNRPPDISEAEIDLFYRQQAIEWIINHPIDFAINGVRKVLMLYNFDPSSVRSEKQVAFRLAGLIPYGVILPFILLGLAASLNRKYIVILWYILFTTLLSIIFFGDSRMRAPIQPFLYIFGAIGVQVCARWCNQSSGNRLKKTDSPTREI